MKLTANFYISVKPKWFRQRHASVQALAIPATPARAALSARAVPVWRDVTRLSRDVIKHSVLRDAAHETQRDTDKSWLETDQSDLEYTSVQEISASI